MKIQFSRKVVLFYAGTLGAVVLLFQQVTQYGETHLQAPPNLNGRYVSVDRLPGCPIATRLALDIQQSGIYLSGSLRLLNPQTATEKTAPVTGEEKPSLHGLWQSEQLMLSGSTPAFADCQTSTDSTTSSPTSSTVPVNIEGSLRSEPASLNGKIGLGTAEPIAFTAQREAAPAPSPKH
jgi:hypothetical protein